MIFASGLKYVGVGTTALGWALCSILLVASSVWLASARPWQKELDPPGAGGDGGLPAVSAADPD